MKKSKLLARIAGFIKVSKRPEKKLPIIIPEESYKVEHRQFIEEPLDELPIDSRPVETLFGSDPFDAALGDIYVAPEETPNYEFQNYEHSLSTFNGSPRYESSSSSYDDSDTRSDW
jgi:hypothetical protein